MRAGITTYQSIKGERKEESFGRLGVSGGLDVVEVRGVKNDLQIKGLGTQIKPWWTKGLKFMGY